MAGPNRVFPNPFPGFYSPLLLFLVCLTVVFPFLYRLGKHRWDWRFIYINTLYNQQFIQEATLSRNRHISLLGYFRGITSQIVHSEEWPQLQNWIANRQGVPYPAAALHRKVHLVNVLRRERVQLFALFCSGC